MVAKPDPADFEDRDERAVAIGDAAERRYGKYILTHRIASGGMGTVYLGRERGPHGFDRPVAIKRIHEHLASRPAFVEMFLDEARIAARISHPNVCTVLDFGSADGTYFIAMEFLVGVPLATLLSAVARDAARLSSERWRALAARMLADAAEGLHAAHQLRDADGRPLHVVHRDVSPHNLFVTFDGAVKVVDFGVARAESRVHQTTSGTLKGKLAYMAPEHASGLEVDRRADVWSLGVCAFEMLTGRRLFKRRNEMDTLMAVREEPLLPPSSIDSTIPKELDDAVMRALARDRDERYPTARAFGRAMSEFVQSQLVPTSLAELEEFMAGLLEREKSDRIDLVKTARLPGTPHTESIEPEPSTDLRAPSPEASGVSTRRARRSRGVAIAIGAAALAAIVGVAVGVAVGASSSGSGERADLGDPRGVPSERAPRERMDDDGPSSERARADEVDRAGDRAPSAIEGRSEPLRGSVDPGAPDSQRPRARAAAKRSDRVSRATGPPSGTDDPVLVGRDRRAEERESPAGEAARNARGELRVVTLGGSATIALGGRVLGETPGTFGGLTPGRQPLVVRWTDGRVERRSVLIESGRTTVLRLRRPTD